MARGDEADLEQRGADHHRGRHADQVDHRRHHDEAAADAENRREQAAERADQQRHEHADVEPGVGEAHLERPAVHPEVLMQAAAARARPRAAEDARRRLSTNISAPIVPRKST